MAMKDGVQHMATGNVLSGSGMQINAPINSISQYFGGKGWPMSVPTTVVLGFDVWSPCFAV